MNRLYIKLFLVPVLLAATGCFNSESEYEQVVSDRDSYAAQLAAAKEENEILKQALADVTAEQEKLQSLLDVERSRLVAGAVPLGTGGGATAPGVPPTPDTADDDDIWVEPSTVPESEVQRDPPPASSGRVYVVKPGDVLYYIASRNNTTVEAILELNPQLRERRNYMIHENEKIRLP